MPIIPMPIIPVAVVPVAVVLIVAVSMAMPVSGRDRAFRLLLVLTSSPGA
jgi:hypothetical protein